MNKLSRRRLLRRGSLGLGGALALVGAIAPSNLVAQKSGSDLPTAVPVRIIVVDSSTEADRILQRLQKGENFATIATQRSIDPTSKDGGFLGVVDPATLRPELREALRRITPGEFTPVVRIPEGYAILTTDVATNDRGMAGGGDSSTATLALTGPGAVVYGPDVDGFREAFDIFNLSSEKPRDWDRLLSPVKLAELKRHTITSAVGQLQEMVSDESSMPSEASIMQTHFLLAQLYAFDGEMQTAIEHWERCYQVAHEMGPQAIHFMEEVLGIAHLHKAEMDNDVYLAPGDKCLFPMKKLRYAKPEDSERAAEYFTKFLDFKPDDLAVKWLLNLTGVTLNRYPAGIPREYVLPLARFESTQDIGRFVDVAPQTGLTSFQNAGGVIVDDFRNCGGFDVVTSEMGDMNPDNPLRYFQNNGDGTFTDRTEKAGLKVALGGLNLIQADFNNDGNLDFLVLRGGWVYPMPLTLFRGNGDGTFTDVTKEAGLDNVLVSTQTAVWADINNDGYLDLFIGNEKGASHLFLNRGDGTFEDISASAGVDKIAYTKGVVAGDFDNDGYVDFYVSNLGSSNFLFKNQHNNTFKEIARDAGVRDALGKCFGTWFFDYDNDGWLDLFVTSFYAGSVDEDMRSYLGMPLNAVTLKLFKNRRDATFEDVTEAVELDKVFMPMGANFGDVDNDGFLDIYLGTGDPSYGSLVPNVLLRNDGGKRFVDITESSGTGDLHKGHGVAFADMANWGHQDILTVIGGATPGDRHAFRYFKNPGNENNWIRIKLAGVKSNRSAIDARIKVTVENEGKGLQALHRKVGSGGSFGASPFEQHVGLGAKAKIREIEITWPASKTTQRFTDVAVNQCIEIKEFATNYTKLDRPHISSKVFERRNV